ncbi:glycosyltransferase [Pseudarthrobacter sp. NPDC058329]|uniref:glycosyltransferase n=1 Tax=Pseudarthrobacter sp. NPDC058329 TaxID=3346448 RepID=UPI0036D993F4
MTSCNRTLIPGAEYILPLRWVDDSALADLVRYLEALCEWIAVTVVDGSPDALFERHTDCFPSAVNHVRPTPGAAGNGKVAAVMTAVRLSTAERLVIADDDVRYTPEGLNAVIAGLDRADIVRPQNYFTTWPWHARWDTSRTLINRAFAGDFPGTLAVSRAALQATGGYAPVLFENLELIRTVTAAGGREEQATALFVARNPPTARHFLRQRVRQAYDDFAQPGRLVIELILLPLLTWILCLPGWRRILALLCAAATAAALAESGRRRQHGQEVFPASTSMFAPLWAVERAICIWMAVALRCRGGVPYAGTRLKTAGHSLNYLRLQHEGKIRSARPAR